MFSVLRGLAHAGRDATAAERRRLSGCPAALSRPGRGRLRGKYGCER
jgi:hypothetical protein